MTKETFDLALQAFKKRFGRYPDSISFEPPYPWWETHEDRTWEKELAFAERVIFGVND
jgi:hypothetical protein